MMSTKECFVRHMYWYLGTLARALTQPRLPPFEARERATHDARALARSTGELVS